MTLEKLKKSAMKLIEEYLNSSGENTNFTEDEDISNKLIMAINSRLQVISNLNKLTYTLKKTKTEFALEIPAETSSVESILCDGQLIFEYEWIGNHVLFEEVGEVQITAYFDLQQIEEDTPNTMELYVPKQYESAMPYGVAADILVGSGESEMIALYSQKFDQMVSLVKPKAKVIRSKHYGL